MYIGRFAPSPTGPLHFGSLVAALASWLDARAARGKWLVRIEDLDRLRVEPGAADVILRQLEALGLEWDGPVLYQSARLESYGAALSRLQLAGAAYWCGCSRREIADSATRFPEPGLAGPPSARPRIYPGTCRSGLPPGKKRRAVRVLAEGEPIHFRDRLQGEVRQSVGSEVGDFIVFRADGLYAYQLAVVVDDAHQGVTDVVRGADLLDSTGRQILLQGLLGLPPVRYLHVPVAVNSANEKLSKQTAAPAILADRPGVALGEALAFLGLRGSPAASAGPREILAWACAHWDVRRIPPLRAAPAVRRWTTEP